MYHDKFWTLLYKRPDLYVYVTDEMVRWLGFQGESRYQKKNMIDTLNARSIHYIYLNIDKTSECHIKVGKDETAAVRPSKNSTH